MSKNLVIVESPAKAKTIEKFLGKDFKVVSSNGHISDLPSSELGINVDETLSILQGFQYVAANPDEVCPANWPPGEKTMLEDPKGRKE